MQRRNFLINTVRAIALSPPLACFAAPLIKTKKYPDYALFVGHRNTETGEFDKNTLFLLFKGSDGKVLRDASGKIIRHAYTQTQFVELLKSGCNVRLGRGISEDCYWDLSAAQWTEDGYVKVIEEKMQRTRIRGEAEELPGITPFTQKDFGYYGVEFRNIGVFERWYAAAPWYCDEYAPDSPHWDYKPAINPLALKLKHKKTMDILEQWRQSRRNPYIGG